MDFMFASLIIGGCAWLVFLKYKDKKNGYPVAKFYTWLKDQQRQGRSAEDINDDIRNGRHP